MLSNCLSGVIVFMTYWNYYSMTIFILALYPSYTYRLNERCYIALDGHQKTIAVVSDEFLSVSIDTAQIQRYDEIFFANLRLRKLAAELAPARLRIGGRRADRLIFSKNNIKLCNNICPENYSKHTCSLIKNSCQTSHPFFTMSISKWKAINDFCKATKLKLLFSVNVLLRNDRGWDDQNAKELLVYSRQKYPDIDWQLGNEPNSFYHAFKMRLTPQALAQDFKHFRKLLNEYGYNKSLLIGPDISRPNKCSSYMNDFLSSASDYINASSFHQYYLRSNTSKLEDFWNPDTMDLLKIQLKTIRDQTVNKHIPMWLSETGSSFGGGAQGLSDSFAGSPLWLDKLGLAAIYNLTTIVRQSFFGGHYGLVDSNLDPLPDWWISVLYKKLVGKQVLHVKHLCSLLQRVYAHCANRKYTNDITAVTIFAVNLENAEIKFLLKGTAMQGAYSIDEYIITAWSNNRKSQIVMLNGEALYFESAMPELKPIVIKNSNHVTMPPYSIGFWVVKNTFNKVCTFEHIQEHGSWQFSDFWFFGDL